MIKPREDESAALRGCLEVCRRCDALVESVAAESGEVYSVLGPHLRHCLDHFTSLLRGLSAGVVDYDARDRDEGMEDRPERFRAALAETVSKLGQIEPGDLERSLRVKQLAAPGAESAPVASTLERELIFLSSHTIHHLALMLHLAASRGVELPEELGVAFSTAAYRAGLEQPAH
jgi:hypothetical protein